LGGAPRNFQISVYKTIAQFFSGPQTVNYSEEAINTSKSPDFSKGRMIS
jgi:hypothetical protein